MGRWIIGAALAAALGTSTASAGAVPHIVSASSSHGHLVVRARFGDLFPETVAVATKPTTKRGTLVRANVVYSARIAVASPPATLRWRSPTKLPSGTYWVQVSGVQSDYVVDCKPGQNDCMSPRSNVVRVVIRN